MSGNLLYRTRSVSHVDLYVGNAQIKSCLLLNNAELAVVVEMKDLGVTVDSRLNFDVHIRQTVRRELL